MPTLKGASADPTAAVAAMVFGCKESYDVVPINLAVPLSLMLLTFTLAGCRCCPRECQGGPSGWMKNFVQIAGFTSA